MSGATWKAAAGKELRTSIRAAFEPAFSCAFASPSAVIIRDGDRYGIVNLPTSNTSVPEALGLFINYGVGTYTWFNARGFGPPKPRSEADCPLHDRHTPDTRLFPDSQFSRLRIPKQEWATETGKARLKHYLTKVTKSEIAPWIQTNWATLAGPQPLASFQISRGSGQRPRGQSPQIYITPRTASGVVPVQP